MSFRKLLDPNSPAGGGAAAPSSSPAAPSATGASFSTGSDPSDSGAAFTSSESPFSDALAQQPAASGASSAGATPPGVPTPAPTPASVREQLAQFGIDSSQFADDASALRALAESHQLRPYAEYGYQMQPYANQFQEWVHAQRQPQQPAQQQPEQWTIDSHFKKLYEAPPYDPQWEKFVTFDPATGLYAGISPQVPYSVVEGVNKYAQWQQQQRKEFFSGNPYKKTYDAVREPILREVQQLMQGVLQQQQQQSYLASYEQRNARHLYQVDQNNNIVVDRFSGQPVQSAYGSRFYQYAQHLSQQGMDQTQVVDLAEKLATGDLLRAQFQASMAAGNAAAPGQAGNAQPAPGVPTPVAASQQQQASFLNSALNRAGHIPSGAAASMQPPSEPVKFQSFGDLEGYFEREARKAGAI